MAKNKQNKKIEEENKLPKKYLYLMRGLFIFTALVIFYVYGKYYNGFNKLWNNLQNATIVLKYVLIFFIIFLVIFVLWNWKKKKDKEYDSADILEKQDDLENLKDKQYLEDLKQANGASNGLKYLVLFVVFIFALLVFCSLLDFFLPLAVLYIALFIIYVIVIKVFEILYNKK